MSRNPLFVGPVARSILGTDISINAIQLGWDGGDACRSLMGSLADARLEIVTDGVEPPQDLPDGIVIRNEPLLKAKVERKYDLVLVPCSQEQFVLAMYMSVESAVVEGGIVIATDFHVEPSREWLISEMGKEGIVALHKNERRELAVFTFEGGKLFQEL